VPTLHRLRGNVYSSGVENGRTVMTDTPYPSTFLTTVEHTLGMLDFVLVLTMRFWREAPMSLAYSVSRDDELRQYPDQSGLLSRWTLRRPCSLQHNQ